MKKFIAFFLVLMMGLLVASAEIQVGKVGDDAYQKVKLRLDSESLVVSGASGVGYGSVTLHTFREGVIIVHGASADLTVTFNTNDVANGAGIDFAVGSVATADGNVTDAGEATVIASTSADPFGLVANTNEANAASSADAHIDGATSAGSLHLNWLVDDADISAVVTATVDGVINVIYSNVGDY